MNSQSILRQFLKVTGLCNSRRRKHRALFCEDLEARQLLSATMITVGTGSSVQTFTFNGSSFNWPTGSYGVSMDGGMAGMGDVNGDGHEDLVLLTPGRLHSFGFYSTPATLLVALNNGSGGFSSYSTWDSSIPLSPSSGGFTWTDMFVADFTGDGKADVVARDRETGVWNLWTSTGSGFSKSTFGTWDIGIQWSDAMVGDFNHDGRADLIGRRIANDPPYPAVPTTTYDDWYVGYGTATATNRGVVGTTGNSWTLFASHLHTDVVANAVVGDFDENAGDELAVRFVLPTQSNGQRSSQWKYHTDGVAPLTWTTAWTTNWDHALPGGIQQHWRDVQAGDVTGDGKDDILARTETGKWYLAVGGTTTTTMVADWSSNGYAKLPTVTGDFDGDHKLELVFWNPSAYQWYRSTFNGTTFNTAAPAGGMTWMSTPKREQMFVNGSASGYSTYLGHRGDLGTVPPLAPLEAIAHWRSSDSAWGGIDGSFFLGRYGSDGIIRFQENGGGVPPSVPMTTATSVETYRADFTGDGLPDMLTLGMDANSPNLWILSTSTGNAFTNAAVTSIPGQWSGSVYHNIKVADFTGDGKSDVLVQVQDTSTTAHWELYAATGTGFATGVTIANLSSTSNDGWLTGGAIGDFDGDGKDDLAIELRSTNPLTPNLYNTYVAYSNGTSAWSITIPWSRVDGASVGDTRLFFIENHGDRVRVGDVNGDGRDDVLGLQNLVGSVTDTGQVWVGLSTSVRGVGTSGSWLNLPAPFDFNAPKDQHIFEVGRFVDLDVKADIVINPTDNLNLARIYRSNGTSFDATPAFTGSGITSYYGLMRPVVSDVDRDGYDDLVWGYNTIGVGYGVSLSTRVALVSLPTENVGKLPQFFNWVGYTTTIPRLLRRRG